MAATKNAKPKPAALTPKQLDHALDRLGTARYARKQRVEQKMNKEKPVVPKVTLQDLHSAITMNEAVLKPLEQISDFRYTNADETLLALFDFSKSPKITKIEKARKAQLAWRDKFDAALKKIDEEAQAIEDQLVMGSDGAAALALIAAFAKED